MHSQEAWLRHALSLNEPTAQRNMATLPPDRTMDLYPRMIHSQGLAFHRATFQDGQPNSR